MDLKELQGKADKIEGYYRALKKQESDLTSEVEGLKTEISVLLKSSAVLKHLLDVMVKDEISKMAGLITYGLKTIFYDQNLKFIPEITKKNEKINIDLKTDNDGIEMEFGSFGGSVAIIEDILLRIICMIKMKLARIMLLDETLAHIGPEYIPGTGKLLAELCKKLDMDVLLVTQRHDSKEFQKYVDNMYKVDKTGKGLVIEKLN